MFNKIKRLTLDIANLYISPLWLLLRERNYIVYYLHGGGFTDNTKYILAYHIKHYGKTLPFRVVSPTCSKDILKFKQMVSDLNGKVFCLKEMGYWKSFLKSAVIVTDHAEWVHNGTYWVSLGSEIFQLWHGVGFKKVGFLSFRDVRGKTYRRLITKIFRILEQRYTVTWLLSTSEFYKKSLFSTSFFTVRGILNIGNYPRNDILFLNEHMIEDYFDNRILALGVDTFTLSELEKRREGGRKIVLLAFTYRNDRYSIYENGTLDLQQLDKIADDLQVVFVVKLHPLEEFYFRKHVVGDRKFRNIYVYSTGSSSDPQPLLKLSDALVTDYSSIYSDFSLMPHKPIVFFPYDYDKYLSSDLGFQFPYDVMTPGPKVYSQQDLIQMLNMMMNGNDEYYESRRKFSKMAFSKHSPVSESIFDFIKARWEALAI
ncbi:CDP-glycerol glycerophosphotransferase family protein [Zhurongbacter thermophilus]